MYVLNMIIGNLGQLVTTLGPVPPPSLAAEIEYLPKYNLICPTLVAAINLTGTISE
jgi:hypothetical protein